MTPREWLIQHVPGYREVCAGEKAKPFQFMVQESLQVNLGNKKILWVMPDLWEEFRAMGSLDETTEMSIIFFNDLPGNTSWHDINLDTDTLETKLFYRDVDTGLTLGQVLEHYWGNGVLG